MRNVQDVVRVINVTRTGFPVSEPRAGSCGNAAGWPLHGATEGFLRPPGNHTLTEWLGRLLCAVGYEDHSQMACPSSCT